MTALEEFMMRAETRPRPCTCCEVRQAARLRFAFSAQSLVLGGKPLLVCVFIFPTQTAQEYWENIISAVI